MSEEHMIRPERLDLASGVPALKWRGIGPPPHPTIISLHGLGGSKLDIGPGVAAHVTSQGVTLVTLDAYMHGDRAPSSGFDREPFTDPDYFVELFAHTAQDVVDVVAQLQEDEETGNISLRGGSVGGFVVLAAIGLGAKVHAALSVCGGADWANTFLPIRNYNPTPSILQRAAQTDPIFHLDRFPPKPVLLIHGIYDDVVPIAGHRHLYDALAPFYQEKPEDCLFLTHAGGHSTPQYLQHFGSTWLIERIR